MSEVKVFTGRSNPNLFDTSMEGIEVLPRGKGSIKQFSDGELFFSCDESVRGADCYVIQSTCYPHNDNLMKLCIIADTLKRASAKNVTAVFPYFGYARQDRQVDARTPITAKLVSNIITASGIDRVAILDVHSSQIQKFFNTPLFDNLQSIPFLCHDIMNSYGSWFPNDVIIVSPDVGGVKKARNFAKKLGINSLAIIDKRREKANESEVMNIIGNVEGKNCILVDDMVDTAGSLCQASLALKEAGAINVIAVATHPILSGAAIKRIEESPLLEMIVSDSIPLSDEAKKLRKIRSVSCAMMLRVAIDRIHRCGSVS